MGNAPKWHTLGQSVRGASHFRSGLPNQDAILWHPESGDGPPFIVAVSDGHGSPRSFRSDVGSRLAVEQVVALILNLLNIADSPSTLSVVKRLAEERLPQELVRRWRQAVAAHKKKHPFSKKELDGVEAKRGAKARREAERDPYLAYGATILGILVTNTFILYLQLGDGDILTVMEDNAVTRPVPGDARLFANQTTSLCTKGAWRDVRYRFQPLYGTPPALIMLSSDGYANSFVSDAGFLKVATDILDILREDGVAAVADNLKDWLTEASKSGSGDDITLALLFRDDVPTQPKEANQQISKAANQRSSAPTDVTESAAEEAIEPKVSVVVEATKDVKAETHISPEVDVARASQVDAVTEKEAEVVTPSPVQPEPEKTVPEPSVADDTSAVPSPSHTESTAETDAAGKRKRRIKDADGPYEPSKKAPTIYYDD